MTAVNDDDPVGPHVSREQRQGHTPSQSRPVRRPREAVRGFPITQAPTTTRLQRAALGLLPSSAPSAASPCRPYIPCTFSFGEVTLTDTPGGDGRHRTKTPADDFYLIETDTTTRLPWLLQDRAPLAKPSLNRVHKTPPEVRGPFTSSVVRRNLHENHGRPHRRCAPPRTAGQTPVQSRRPPAKFRGTYQLPRRCVKTPRAGPRRGRGRKPSPSPPGGRPASTQAPRKRTKPASEVWEPPGNRAKCGCA